MGNLLYLFFGIVAVHGLIHLVGFARVFRANERLPVRKGIAWLLTSILLVGSAVLFLVGIGYWWISASAGIILSQLMIFTVWSEARLGTVVNIIIAIGITLCHAQERFSLLFENDVREALSEPWHNDTVLTEADIASLPGPVRKYIRYAGCIGKPSVNNFKVEFSGRIRGSQEQSWMPFQSVQYNTLESTKRLFFMNAEMKRLPVAGYHRYEMEEASMDIRLLSLLTVQYESGREMGIAETVTFFNDMCVMAPATLADKRIEWLEVRGDSVLAAFTPKDITISAWLLFNKEGQLVNFISDDRYAEQPDGTMRQLRWSTPLGDYKLINGLRLAGFAQTIYTYPDEDLVYGEFETKNIEYNCR